MLQRIALAAIVAAVVLVFHRAALGAFLRWDDDINLVDNPHLKGLTGDALRWMFTDASYMRRYVPLAWLGWGIERELFGLTPRAAHIGNILLHAANAALVFFVLREFLVLWNSRRRPVSPVLQVLAPAAGALIWAVHPLRVEVVAWASGRMYCQAGFFFFGALFAYLKAASLDGSSGRRSRWIGLSALAFGASLLTYPIGLMLPFALIAIDRYVLQRFHRRLPWFATENRGVWLEKIPFFAIAVAVGTATLLARLSAQGLWQPPPTLEQFSLGARIMQACYVWIYYVWKPLFPSGLAPVYTTLFEFDPTQARFLASAVLLIAVSALLFMRRRRWPCAWGSWLAHLLLLAPVLGVTEQPHYTNDRYTYLQGILLSAIASALLVRLWAASARPAAQVITSAVVVIVPLALAGARQVRVWQDSETLFRYLYARVEGTKYRADVAMRLGDTLRIAGRLDEASALYRESLGIVATSVRASIPHFGLAQIAREQGRLAEAAAHYQEAVRLSPDFVEAHAGCGEILLRAGRPAEAAAFLERAVSLQPANATLREMLGVAFYQSARVSEAIAEFRAAAQLRPDSAPLLCNLTGALVAAGQLSEAVRYGREAVRLAPASADAHVKLGEALQQAGEHGEAIAALQEAARLESRSAAVRDKLGSAYAMAGDYANAAEHFRAATLLQPDFADAHYHLGLALRDTNQRATAAQAFEKVLQLQPGHQPAREELARLQRLQP